MAASPIKSSLTRPCARTISSWCRRSWSESAETNVTDLTKLTLAGARDGLRKKQFSAMELTQAFLDAIETGNKHLNAYVLPTPEIALRQAKESDTRLAKAGARPLEGLPLGIKDLYCTKGVRTTACSGILDAFTPTYESTVTQN